MSSLEVCAVQTGDLEATTALTFAAAESNVVTMLIYPTGVTPAMLSYFVEQSTKSWHNDPCVRHMQVKDTHTGEIINYSQWSIFPEKIKAERSKPSKVDLPDGSNKEAVKKLRNNGKRKRDEIMGGKPYICTSIFPLAQRASLVCRCLISTFQGQLVLALHAHVTLTQPMSVLTLLMTSLFPLKARPWVSTLRMGHPASPNYQPARLRGSHASWLASL